MSQQLSANVTLQKRRLRRRSFPIARIIPLESLNECSKLLIPIATPTQLEIQAGHTGAAPPHITQRLDPRPQPSNPGALGVGQANGNRRNDRILEDWLHPRMYLVEPRAHIA